LLSIVQKSFHDAFRKAATVAGWIGFLSRIESCINIWFLYRCL